MSDTIKACPYCTSQPVAFKTSVSANGCSFPAYIIECDNTDDESKLPFIEHRLSVYGANREEALKRWNEVVPDIK